VTVTEEQIMAIKIGERLPIDKIGMTPISPLWQKHKVNGLPGWAKATVCTDGAQWDFSIGTTEERPYPVRQPTTKPHRPFASADEALEALKQCLRDSLMDPVTQNYSSE
jgi:hypothetical protein